MPNGFQLEEIRSGFGCIVSGFDAAELDAADWDRLYQLWLQYAVLVFPAINLSAEGQIAFAERFGPLASDRFAISNIKPDGSLLQLPEDLQFVDMQKGNCHWHCDNSFRPVQFKGTLYTAEIVPDSGGETGFADMRAAFEALDSKQQAECENLTARHSIQHGQKSFGYTILDDTYFVREEWPGPLRPLVKIHPETGRKSLLIGRHAHSVSGMGEEQSREFLSQLVEFACQPQRVFYHSWRPGDAVLWDNRCVLHRGVGWEMAAQPRLMWHTPIAGDPVTEAALEMSVSC
jgi:alpha-ketoglutarate-dependent taurine dioxygenase